MWRWMCIINLFPRGSGYEQTAESKKHKTKQKRIELLFSPSRFQFENLLKSFQANKKNSSKTFKVSHINALQLIWYSYWCHFQWKLCLGPSRVLTLISLSFCIADNANKAAINIISNKKKNLQTFFSFSDKTS